MHYRAGSEGIPNRRFLAVIVLVLGVLLSQATPATLVPLSGSLFMHSQSSLPVPLALTADFTFSPGHPVIGETVTFTASLQGETPPVIYSWDFGDGGTDTGNPASHPYGSDGSFLVTLTVNDSAPDNATVSHSVPVTPVLTADFTFSPAQPVVGQTVSFTGTAAGGTPSYTYSWTFGDGGTGSGSTPTHVYGSANTFTVTLTVSDSGGHVASKQKSVVVASAVSADFTFTPSQPVVGQTVSFTATASGGIPPYTYAWTFGDGGTGSGATPTHTYSAVGTYTVTLTVSDNAAHTAVVSKSVSVAAGLAADFTFSPVQPVVGETVSFTATASGGIPPYTYSWTFGDGGTGSGATPTHVYGSANTFTVTLTVSDNAAHTGVVSKSVPVAAVLTADFSFSPTQPVIGETVSFTATASGGITPYTYAWDFGDGGTGSGRTPTHAFSSAGTFTVSLTVTDSAAHVAAVSHPVPVTPVLTADFTFSPAQPAVGETVTFSGSATGGTSPYTYGWTFGDGGTASGATVTHAYSAAGSYTVVLTVHDVAGHTATAAKPVPVATDLAADFTFSPAQPVVGETVSFSATASGGSPPYTYSWDFGDGGTGSGATASHAYAVDGSFTVTLTVTDSLTRVATVPHSVAVTPSVTTDFTFTPIQPAINEAVTFSGTASGGTSPYTYTWAFGDGGTGSGATTSHAYATEGSYTVTLTVDDSAGHVATASHLVSVASKLGSSFTFLPAQPVIGENVTFSGSAGGGTPPYTFNWDFGDANTSTGISVSHAYGTARTYLVHMYVSDAVNRSTTAANTITVGFPLSGNYTYKPKLPLIFEQINFTATASGGITPYTYAWDFDDGSTGAGKYESHGYTSAGFYNVTLTVSDSAGHSLVVVQTLNVGLYIAADFTASQSFPVIGEVVNFSAEARGANPPYTFAWNFGDGSTATEANVSHAYRSSRSVTVTLTVTDSANHNAVVKKPIIVTTALAVDFTFTPTQPVIDEKVFFTAAAAGATPPYSYDWTLGDGSNQTGAIVVNLYGTPGNYTVNLTVFDSKGHNVTISKVISLTPLLLANFTFSPIAPVNGESISFNGTATGGTEPYTFQWAFGDSATSEGMNVSHAYASARNFTATLTVFDSAGHRVRFTVMVTVGPAVDAAFSFTPNRPLMGRAVSFVAGASGGAPPYTFDWDFGDGKWSEGSEVNHTYSGFGFSTTHVVTLTVCDSANRCTDVIQEVTLENVFSVAIVAEGGFAALIVAIWIFMRRRGAEATD